MKFNDVSDTVIWKGGMITGHVSKLSVMAVPYPVTIKNLSTVFCIHMIQTLFYIYVNYWNTVLHI